ncbi:L-lysine N6-monooxygenase [Paraconexibacter sp. AEG42_29]|uniref:L-lysine N6-monooxygenase MbtG n=1 Tax=Paraconexibacter sp. AEG42_29 TaxID=2997339 RepID=A0AAU7B2T1_9ACTN
MSARVHDVAGIGLGPFNLGLAALLDPVGEVDAAFFEAQPTLRWHPGLMLDGAALQVPHLADLVTLADPTSRHGFLNYLHEHERLYRFYFAERWHPSRREYEHYCRWVAGRLASCRFGARVVDAGVGDDGLWTLTVAGADGSVTEHRSRALVAGVGGRPYVPPCAQALVDDGDGGVLHSAAYLDHRAALRRARRVTVIGSGQSAAEVFLDLLGHAGGTRLQWFTRSRGFFPMEYSKLGLEHFTPEYTRYFHGLEPGRRDTLRAGQDLLYKGISAETSAAIYDAIYDRSVGGEDPGAAYAASCELVGIERAAGGLRLTLHQRDQDITFRHETDAVVLGTGYESTPLPISGLAALADADERGRLRVGLDYRVALRDPDAPALYVQNAELHTHGVGTPDLGLGAFRNSVIVNGLCGREVYKVRDRNVFQTFGAPGPGVGAPVTESPRQGPTPVRHHPVGWKTGLGAGRGAT